MSFTYSVSNLTTDLAQVRLRIGDTVDCTAGNESLHDEEINPILTDYPSVNRAAVVACEYLIARLRTKTDRNAVGITASARQKLDGLLDTLKILEKRAAKGSSMSAFVGMTSIAESDTIRDDDDYDAPFAMGMHDKEYSP